MNLNALEASQLRSLATQPHTPQPFGYKPGRFIGICWSEEADADAFVPYYRHQNIHELGKYTLCITV
jgi:hypothetical protein